MSTRPAIAGLVDTRIKLKSKRSNAQPVGGAAEALYNGTMSAADVSAVLFLNTAAISAGAATIAVFFAQDFPYLLVLAFVVFAVRHHEAVREKLTLLFEGFAAAFIARFVFVEVIRLFVHRLRPFVANPHIHALLSESSYSFPSGHAAFFFALATAVYVHNKSASVWFFLAALLIGMARVAAGVHYPSDILGGAVLGVAVGWAAHRLFSRKKGSGFRTRQHDAASPTRE